MYEHFNVSCYTANPLSMNHSPLARIYNSLLKAINDSTHLPRIIIFVIDGDVLEAIDCSTSGKNHVIDSAWKWIVDHTE